MGLNWLKILSIGEFGISGCDISFSDESLYFGVQVIWLTC